MGHSLFLPANCQAPGNWIQNGTGNRNGIRNGSREYKCRNTVCFFSFVLRNKADVSLFWEIWGHQRLPSDHKIGRKLPFGKKHHLMSFAIIQEDDGPKEEFQDEPI